MDNVRNIAYSVSTILLAILTIETVYSYSLIPVIRRCWPELDPYEGQQLKFHHVDTLTAVTTFLVVLYYP